MSKRSQRRKKQHGMTDKAWRAWLVFRDLGPQRTFEKAAEILGYSGASLLYRWSADYHWSKLCADHDHAQLREALGQRSVIRERAIQQLVDAAGAAVAQMLAIMVDEQRIPILNRDGTQMKDKDGNELFKPQVRASTRLEAAKAILGIAGLVPVKRMEVRDTSGEALDEAAGLINSLNPDQLRAVIKAMVGGDGEG